MVPGERRVVVCTEWCWNGSSVDDIVVILRVDDREVVALICIVVILYSSNSSI